MSKASEARAETVRKERRHKRGATVNTGMKLTVDEKNLDPNFVRRFVNDKPGRIQAMTEGGEWDIVQDPNKVIKSDATGEGTGVSVVVGSHEYGAPMRGYLLQKPKWIHDEDQADKRRELDKTMAAIKRGQPQSSEGAAIAGAFGYVPEGGISIREES